MKYIKVLKFNEYSIFEVIEEYEKTIKCKLNNCENGYIIIGKNNVVKQADTIEELCDEFVLLEKNSKPRIFTTLKGAINNKIYDDEEIYGAIWTDKGLIYVAKMDNEGCLKLI